MGDSGSHCGGTSTLLGGVTCVCRSSDKGRVTWTANLNCSASAWIDYVMITWSWTNETPFIPDRPLYRFVPVAQSYHLGTQFCPSRIHHCAGVSLESHFSTFYSLVSENLNKLGTVFYETLWFKCWEFCSNMPAITNHSRLSIFFQIWTLDFKLFIFA